MIRVVVADDHAVVREGICRVLEATSAIVVVGQAADGREAVRVVRETHPDVAVLDIAMPELDGIEATRRIVHSASATRCVLLSMHTSPYYARAALEAGASGFVVKGASGQELVAAVRAAHSGHRHLSQELLDAVLGEVALGSAMSQSATPFSILSPREREVIRRVAEGETSAAIAGQLNLSAKTVETYRSRAMAKLGAKSLPDLVRLAIKHEIIG